MYGSVKKTTESVRKDGRNESGRKQDEHVPLSMSVYNNTSDMYMKNNEKIKTCTYGILFARKSAQNAPS